MAHQEIEQGKIALIRVTEDGRIQQLGMTKEQSEMLQVFIAALSKEYTLYGMPEQYDLTLKNQ